MHINPRCWRDPAAALWPIAGLLIAWQVTCLAGWVAPGLLPPPSAIVARLLMQLQSATFQFDLAQTVLRLTLGFVLALLIGVVAGMVMSQAGEAVLGPVVKLLAPIPKIALYPAMVLVLGFGHASKVALVVADAAFPIMLATFHGARSVQPKLLWSAWAAGAGRSATLLTVLLPAALPSILTGCRIGLTIACVNVFLAEMISSTDGLGHALIVAARSYQVVDMFVPLVVISLIGLALGALLQLVRRSLPGALPD